MFDSITSPHLNGFMYQFEKIRNAIHKEDQSHSNIIAATTLGLDTLDESFSLFKEELKISGHLPGFEFELNTYMRAIEKLRDYFGDNKSSMTECDAWIYSEHLEIKHETFCEMAADVERDNNNGQ